MNGTNGAGAGAGGDVSSLGLEMEPLTGGSGGGGAKDSSVDPPAHKAGRLPPNRTASFGNNGITGSSGRSAGNKKSSSASAWNGTAPARSRAMGGRSRLLGFLFLLLGLAMLLVMRGEEEVEMEIEAEYGGDAGGGGSSVGDYGAAAADPLVDAEGNDQPLQQTSAPPPPPPTPPPSSVAKTSPPTNAPAAAPKDENPAESDKTNNANTESQTDEDKKKALIEKYGEWHFWDGEPETRPKDDYCSKYPNRDITENDFPDTAWQVDAVYANHFLNDASNLVSRAQEAIYEEYGHGKPLPPEQMMARSRMMKLHKVDLTGDDTNSNNNAAPQPPDDYMNSGGWTTDRSFRGLVRRLLHAVMTNDSFTVVVLGDGPEASGVGNHFAQIYGMQFERIMEPIFARLNTKFIVRHMVREGGVGGPLVDGMGFADLVGRDIDLLVWDSSGLDVTTTAGGGNGGTNYDAELDLLIRQAALSGNRIPYVLDGGGMALSVLKDLHNSGGIDVGGLGMGLSGIAETESDEQAATLPWAVRYLRCKKGKEDLCEKAENKYLNTCWVERKGVKPPTKQDDHIVGADKSHPGWRYHQLKGRMLAGTVLEALQEAINTWSDVTITGGHPLPDEYWHVTDYYKESRDKMTSLDAGVGSCLKLKDYVPERVCKTAMTGRSEFTPRPMPESTSISSIIKPAEGGYVPKVEDKLLYDGPDDPPPALDIPDDAIDVRFVVSAGIRRRRRRRRLNEDAIVPGLGWQVHGELPGVCDGTATGICGRLESSTCLLDGHMDSKGGVLGNEYSGWLVFTVKDVKEGIIMLALETSHDPSENDRTKDWTEARTSEKQEVKKDGDAVDGGEGEKADEENKAAEHDAETEKADEKNETDGRRLRRGYSQVAARTNKRRRLLPEAFKFDFAIDGKVTTLDKRAFEERIKKPRDNLELLTVLDDASAKAGKEIEVAIRMRDCGRDCAFALTHVYWA